MTTRELAPSIWYSNTLPDHWIIEGDDEELYIVAANSNGWANRRSYKGHRVGLIRANAAISNNTEKAIGAGFEFLQLVSKPLIRARYMDEALR